ncbi:MAG: polysaccharide biosynthesis/export family protein [Janthinobacterium lividum]
MSCPRLSCSNITRPASLLFLLIVSLNGCALPRSAPLLSEVRSSDKEGRIVLTAVTPPLVESTREPETASYPPSLLQVAPFDYERFAPGDGVDIMLWERDGLQVFPAGTSGGSDLGVFTIGSDGNIDVPYIGALHLAGLTASEARSSLLRRLSRIVIATDVRIAHTDQRGGQVSVQGAVTKPGSYPIGQGMLRLGAALGLAAPDQTDLDQTQVTLRRDGTAATVRLGDIYRDPVQDIALRPGDAIVVSALQQYVTVIGAVGGQGRVKIVKRNYSVLDALADSRGFADASADLQAVFLLRSAPAPVSEADRRPSVFQFDMRQADQVAMAGKFAVRSGDVVFISNAPFAQVQKVLSALSYSLNTVRSAGAIAQ